MSAKRGRQGDDRGQDVQAQLRPAVGILVEAQTQRRRHEHDAVRPMRRAGAEVRRGSTGDGGLERDDDGAGETRRRDELEVAAPGVVAVGHPGGDEGVQPTEQVGDLQADEQRRPRDPRDEHDEGLRRPEEPDGADRARRRGAERRARPSGSPRGDPQEAGGEPRAGEHEQQPPGQVAEVDAQAEHVVHRPPEDRVGRGEQDREDHGEGHRQEQAAHERDHARGGTRSLRAGRARRSADADAPAGAARRACPSSRSPMPPAG